MGKGETFINIQVASPALVLFQRHGSPVEHAILLCDLFLGLGVDAYVCLGTSTSTEIESLLLNIFLTFEQHNPTAQHGWSRLILLWRVGLLLR